MAECVIAKLWVLLGHFSQLKTAKATCMAWLLSFSGGITWIQSCCLARKVSCCQVLNLGVFNCNDWAVGETLKHVHTECPSMHLLEKDWHLLQNGRSGSVRTDWLAGFTQWRYEQQFLLQRDGMGHSPYHSERGRNISYH